MEERANEMMTYAIRWKVHGGLQLISLIIRMHFLCCVSNKTTIVCFSTGSIQKMKR